MEKTIVQLNNKRMRYTRLAFNGGGVKGLAFCGALEALEKHLTSQDRSIFNEVEHLAGASIGAFVGMLLCMRVPVADIRNELFNLKFKDFSGVVNIAKLPENWCILHPDYYKTVIRNALKTHLGRDDVTFKQFSQQTGCRLSVTVSCLNPSKPGNHVQYHDTVLTPDYEVWRSVTASGSIPLILSPIEAGRELWVDGGLLDNFALNLFPDDMVDSLSFQLVQSDKPIDSLSAYVYQLLLLYSNIEAHKSFDRLTDAGKLNVIRINTGNVNSWDINLDLDTETYLVESGKQAMNRMLCPGTVIKECLNFVLKDISALLSALRLKLTSKPTSEETVVEPNRRCCSSTRSVHRRHSWPYSSCEAAELLLMSCKRL